MPDLPSFRYRLEEQPPKTVSTLAANLGVPDEILAKLPRDNRFIVPPA